MQYDNEKVTLSIAEAFLKDAGTYVLSAKNIAGEASTSCNVVVKGRLPNETSDSEVASDMDPVKPSVVLPLKDTSIFEGKAVKLDCIIVAQPEPEVVWYFDQRPVKESPDIQLLFQGDRCTLVIQEAFLEDAGEYKVVAINSAGEAFSSCKLSVTPLNIAEPAIRPSTDRLLPSEMPPKFEKLLSDILVVEGETVEFECSLVSGLKSTIKWYLNNKEITCDDDRIKSVYSENDGSLKLVIENVSPNDKGVYTVKASNSSGDAKCFSHLIVKSVINGTEVTPTKVEPEEKLLCPTFKELFADRSVGIEDSTRFECIIVGKPTPKIKWYFNDEPVHGSNFLVSTSGERQVLAIPKVLHENVGKISCVAENEVGKATCVAFLTLTSSATPFKSEEQFTTQEDISGSSFVTMQKHITTTTVTRESNITSNDEFTTHFQSSEVPKAKLPQDMPKESEQPPPQIVQQKIISFTKNDTTDKHESIIAHSGQITTGKPIRRNIAPRFVSPLIGKIVDQGADVVLEGILDGYPTPQIEVTKNGAELVNAEGHVNVSYSLNKVVITLFNVTVSDAGRYSCTATNDAGQSTSTADLVVKSRL